MSYSLQTHGLQHTSFPCPSVFSGVRLSVCPLSQWCHTTISLSITPFSFCPQSFPALGSFPVSQIFPSGDQSIGISVSASALPINIQDGFPLGLTSLMFLLSKGLSRVFSSTTIWKNQFFSSQPSLRSKSHICKWLLGKS